MTSTHTRSRTRTHVCAYATKRVNAADPARDISTKRVRPSNQPRSRGSVRQNCASCVHRHCSARDTTSCTLCSVYRYCKHMERQGDVSKAREDKLGAVIIGNDGAKYKRQRTLTKPICSAKSRKQRRHSIMLYLRTMACTLPQRRLHRQAGFEVRGEREEGREKSQRIDDSARIVMLTYHARLPGP